MKPSAYLINTSRGPIVDEKALLKTLQEHKIAGAGLDVFEPEPLPSGHPFLDLDNVLLTPHLGYVTQEGYRIMYPDTVEDIKAYLAGKPVRVFNPEVIGKNRGIKASKG
jgi:phosphoglycerate dehydrogenase-like enzyme